MCLQNNLAKTFDPLRVIVLRSRSKTDTRSVYTRVHMRAPIKKLVTRAKTFLAITYKIANLRFPLPTPLPTVEFTQISRTNDFRSGISANGRINSKCSLPFRCSTGAETISNYRNYV